jgi:hypothetical protein
MMLVKAKLFEDWMPASLRALEWVSQSDRGMELEWISVAGSLFATRVQYFVEQTKRISSIGGIKELSCLAVIPDSLRNLSDSP